MLISEFTKFLNYGDHGYFLEEEYSLVIAREKYRKFERIRLLIGKYQVEICQVMGEDFVYISIA